MHWLQVGCGMILEEMFLAWMPKSSLHGRIHGAFRKNHPTTDQRYHRAE
jgi:hypothetical protein